MRILASVVFGAMIAGGIVLAQGPGTVWKECWDKEFIADQNCEACDYDCSSGTCVPGKCSSPQQQELCLGPKALAIWQECSELSLNCAGNFIKYATIEDCENNVGGVIDGACNKNYIETVIVADPNKPPCF